MDMLKIIDTTEKLAFAFWNLKLEPQDDVSYHLKIILNYLDQLEHHQLIWSQLSKHKETDEQLKKAIYDIQVVLADMKTKTLARKNKLWYLYE